MAGKENIRTCLFCGCWWLSSYMTEPHLEIGAVFPDCPIRLWIAAYAKLAPAAFRQARQQSLE